MFQKNITKVVLSIISAKIIRQKSSILQIFFYILTAINKNRCKFSAIREFINRNSAENVLEKAGFRNPCKYCSTNK